MIALNTLVNHYQRSENIKVLRLAAYNAQSEIG